MSRTGRRKRAAVAAALFGGMAGSGAADGKGPGNAVACITSTSLGQVTACGYDPEDKKESVIDFVKKLCEYRTDELRDLVNGRCGPLELGLLGASRESAYFYDDDDDEFYPYYDDDDDDVDYEDTEDDYDEDTNDSVVNLVPGTFCGFRKSFLCLPAMSQSNLPSNNMMFDLKMPTRHRVTAEEAEKNANELVAEEERKKNKAEKKRLKKKRQKDRKRQQKLEEEFKNNKENKTEKHSINECNKNEENKKNVVGSATLSSEEESQGSKEESKLNNNSRGTTADGSDEEDESEDELDMCSTFVSQVRLKVDKKPKVEKKERATKPEGKEPVKKVVENVPETNLLHRSMALAGFGNDMAKLQCYNEAVSYFTEAIKLNPREYRLFGNRSYCYERMLQYKEALNDAEVALSLMPHWPKGYFRKGKALMGLKRYFEAKSTFEAVLKADETYVDAALELQRCQMQILLERRYARENEHMPQVPQLFPGTWIPRPSQPLLPAAKIENKTKMATVVPCFKDLRKHDANGSATSLSYKNKMPMPSEIRENVREDAGSNLMVQPLKPGQLYPIWVGNVTPRIAGNNLKSLFEPFGHIHSIRILYDRTCAFINFSDKEAAERAFCALQGIQVEGTKFILQLRNPEHAGIIPGAAQTNPAQKPLPK